MSSAVGLRRRDQQQIFSFRRVRANSRDTGTPAQNAFSGKRIDDRCGRRPRSTVISLKKVSLSTSTPSTASSFSASWIAFAWLRCASRRSPSSPSNDRWMVKARAHRPELVQMLLVAFFAADMLLAGRQGQHIAPPAVGIDGLAAQPAGHLAHVFLRVANSPTWGPPKLRDCRSGWPSAATISAPMSPGGFSAPSDTTSVNATTSNAPIVTGICKGCRSRTRPNKSGFWTTTQAVSSSISAATSSSPDGYQAAGQLQVEKARASR